MLDCILDASEFVAVDDFPSRPDDKEIADVLIEDDLRRRARIRAADDDGEGCWDFAVSARRALVGFEELAAAATKRALPDLSLASAGPGCIDGAA